MVTGRGAATTMVARRGTATATITRCGGWLGLAGGAGLAWPDRAGGAGRVWRPVPLLEAIVETSTAPPENDALGVACAGLPAVLGHGLPC